MPGYCFGLLGFFDDGFEIKLYKGYRQMKKTDWEKT
jgi:hypothetical protein